MCSHSQDHQPSRYLLRQQQLGAASASNLGDNDRTQERVKERLGMFSEHRRVKVRSGAYVQVRQWSML
jgi:hypothetical protein